MKKKITVFLIVAALIMSYAGGAFALSKSSALKTARKYVPKNAILVDTDKEGKGYEFEFITKNRKKEYQVEIKGNGKVHEVEMERKDMDGGRYFKISKKKAKKKVAKAYKAKVTAIKKKRDDGCIYKVYFSNKKYYGNAEVNAQNGKIIESERKYR